MRILFFGDIVGELGRKAVKSFLPKLVEKYNIDFVIANGENATHGKGLIEKHYDELIDAGVDCITLGNHYLSKDNILTYLDEATCLVRPINIKTISAGEGSVLFDVDGQKVRVTNILGQAFMKEEVLMPYYCLKEVINANPNENSIHIVDYHAEATGEKACFAYVFDGEVSAVIGTHTHVQTNDARILENGTAFISDVGMCGAANGVLGFEKESVIKRTIFGEVSKFELDRNDNPMVNAVVMDFDDLTHKCNEIFSIKLIGEKYGE